MVFNYAEQSKDVVILFLHALSCPPLSHRHVLPPCPEGVLSEISILYPTKHPLAEVYLKRKQAKTPPGKNNFLPITRPIKRWWRKISWWLLQF